MKQKETQQTASRLRALRQLGARFLDAPFTGSKGAAEKRQLVYYIGGEEQDFLRAKPILEATSKAIVHIGNVGQAAVVKVVTNLISAVTVQTLAEALAIVRRAGIRPEALAAAIENNAMRSGVTEIFPASTAAMSVPSATFGRRVVKPIQ